jgi:hypothetical protein
MENQNLKLRLQCAPILIGIAASRSGRDGNVAEIHGGAFATITPAALPQRSSAAPGLQTDRVVSLDGRKRQYVGRAPFFAKRLIHPRDLRVAYKADRGVRFLEAQRFTHAIPK